MIRAKDIVAYKTKASWIRRGIDYAILSWPMHFNRMGKASPYTRIEKIIIGLVAQCAFEQYLKDNGIPFSFVGRTPWYAKDRYDVGLGEMTCDAKGFLLDKTRRYLKSRGIDTLSPQNPSWLLDCTALVPMTQFNPSKTKEERRMKARPSKKIYVFAFVHGFFKGTTGEKSIVHAFWDYAWLKKAERKHDDPLGRLTFEYKSPWKDEIVLELVGTKKPKSNYKERLSIKSGGRKSTQRGFHQAFTLSVCDGTFPSGTLTIRSESGEEEVVEAERGFDSYRDSKKTLVVEKNGWSDIWLYDSLIYLAGHITDTKFRLRGQKHRRHDKKIKQYTDTLVDNWGIEASKLYPLSKLVGR